MKTIISRLRLCFVAFFTLFLFTPIVMIAQLPHNVTIQGTGTNSAQVPFSAHWSYTYTQQIYLASEIGFAGDICRLKVSKVSVADTAMQYVKIFLGYTSSSSFASTTSWVPQSALTPVFEGVINFNNGWTEIILDSYFEYNGTSNLVMAVHYVDTVCQSMQNFVTATKTGASLVLRENSPINLNALPAGSILNQRNHLEIAFNRCNGTVMTDTTITACALLISDPGGDGDYENNTSITQTFVSADGNAIVLDFYEFSLSDYDYLSIYDGPNVGSPLLGTFMGTELIGLVEASGTEMTLRFVSNGVGVSSGWLAGLSCRPCYPVSTAYGSPCDGMSMNAFCTENTAGVSYPSGTGGNAVPFFGTSSVACLGTIDRPSAWYYMRVRESGNLLIFIQQFSTSGTPIDVDFACWGPFEATTAFDFQSNLCCGRYDFHSTPNGGDHRPPNGDHSNGNLGGYPFDNLVDCSYHYEATEWCFIPDAQVGEFYLLLLTNFNGNPGTISFNSVGTSYTSSETDCSLVSLASSNSPVCEGGTLSLHCGNVGAGLTYRWQGPNGFVSTDRSPVIYNATEVHEGTYTLQLSTANGDVSTAQVEVEINPMPEVTISADRETLCLPDSARIVVSGATTYLWSNGATDSVIVVSPLETTHYEVIAANAGCSEMAEITIYSHPSPVIVLDEVIDATCGESNGSISVTVEGGTAPLQFNWSNGSTQPYLLENLTGGDFTLRLTDSAGCRAEMDFAVGGYPFEMSIAKIIHASCNKNNGSVEISVTTSADSYEVTWDGITDYEGNTAFNLFPGHYTVTVDDGTCVNSLSFTIQNINRLKACISISPSPPNFVDDILNFVDCSKNATSWRWDFGDMQYSTNQHPTHQYPESGEYEISLIVEDDEDCADTANLTLVIKDKTSFYVPNAFSPNGDGLNDIFKPEFLTIDMQAYKMLIYDRLGTLVFYTENPESGWDGTVNGKEVTTASYSYIIQYRDHLGKNHVAKGAVLLTK